MERIRTAMVAATLTTLSLGSLTLPAPAAASASSTTPASIGALASTASPSSLTYVVSAGDYLTGIAKKLGVKIDDLLAVNKITVTSVIIPGQKLIVPEGGTLPAPTATPAATPAAAAPAPAAPPAPYVVVAGDSLARIASKLGVSMTSLLRANKLTVTSVIHPGAQLTVPAGATLPAPATAPTAPAIQTVNAPAATPAATPLATYTVVAGDYLVGIAAKNGVTQKALLAANNLITTSAIFPGRQLSLPPATLPLPAAATPAPVVTPTPAAAPAADPAAPTPSQALVGTVVAFLQAQVGKPYVFNTAGPDTYDCSGLVMAAYQTVGISLPHQSLLQSTKGTAVDWYNEPLLPGDLIFQYSSANPTVIGHVGIVIDATRWVQAASSTMPIKVGLIPNDDKIKAVRRIIQP